MSTYLYDLVWSSGCGVFIISATLYTILHNALIRVIEKSETSKILLDSQRELRKATYIRPIQPEFIFKISIILVDQSTNLGRLLAFVLVMLCFYSFTDLFV